MRLRYFARKIAEAVLLIFVIITLNFFMIRFMPGDPLLHLLGEEEYLRLEQSEPETLAEIRAYYGLDQSYIVQYGNYLWKTAHGDFGNSYRTNYPVSKTILYRVRWTLLLAIPATILAGVLGALTGLLAGWKKRGWFDLTFSPIFLVITTVPAYCIAIVALMVFAFQLKLFPLGGYTIGGLSGWAKLVDVVWHMLLPLSILILNKTASNYLMMKSTVTQIKNEAYISTAISKGLSEKKVILRHLFKNALGPYITVVCMQFGTIFSGTMLVEIVFSWRGMGNLVAQSASTSDFPMIQASFLLVAVCVVVFNLIADILCMLIDPRIKEGMLNA
jgi:peptide/nickel transport system permease protein